MLFLNPYFQNPTGTTLSLQRRQHLVELAERYGLVILGIKPP
jgi:2-aminoadipate transaminase